MDYLNESNWPKVAKKFAEDGSIQLVNFLRKGLAEKVCACLLWGGVGGHGSEACHHVCMFIRMYEGRHEGRHQCNAMWTTHSASRP